VVVPRSLIPNRIVSVGLKWSLSESLTVSPLLSAMKKMTTTPQTEELLSALADSHLTSAECIATLDACRQDSSLLSQWNAYHLVGDVLRSSAPGVALGADMAFVGRLQKRLQSEAIHAGTVLQSNPALRLQSAEHGIVLVDLESPARRQKAANDASFRWKIVAGFASIAAVCAIAWSTFGLFSPSDAPQLALDIGNEQVLVASPMGPMVRDVRLEEQLADHRQLGSSATLQMPSGFFRNAAFETTKNGGR
jgi:sigma-E factor negative regulatory protein RseA